jgi:hypothetical protein
MSKKKKVNLEYKLKDMDKILENLNSAFEPISKEIEQNLKKLEKITGIKEDYSFKPFSMEDLK